jgi:hypothetical protein
VNNIPLTTLTAGLTYTDVDNVVRNVTPTDAKFHYCKRNDGPGAGAQQYVKFLHNPCTPAGLGPDWGSNTFLGPVKHEVSGSRDMELCLVDFNDGTQTAKEVTTVNPDVFNTTVNPSPAVKAWAIGAQSLENNANGLKHYKFVKINGYAPTLENVFRGHYEDWVEPTFQIRNTITDSDVRLVIETIARVSPETIAPVTHPFGVSGWMGDGNKFVCTDPMNPAYPVNRYSHGIVGDTNSCQTPVSLPCP